MEVTFMSTPLIELNEASKHYLDTSFSLSLDPGKTVLITGANGVGKTTLIHLLLGYTKPNKGDIKRRAKQISYVPEHITLPSFVTALTYMKTIAGIRKLEFKEDLITRFNVPMFKSIRTLSKGNQRKLALCAALLGRPDLVILDEPLDGLDEAAKALLAIIIEEKMKEGIAFVIATHDTSVFESLASETYAL